jgi:hypothetical protein
MPDTQDAVLSRKHFANGSIALLAIVAATLLPAARSKAADAPNPVINNPVTKSPVKQKKVYVGIHLNQITSVSLKEEQFAVDFHVWFRWTDDDIKPLETFDLVNGQIDNKEDVYQAKLDGVNYAVCRVVGKIHKLWDVSDFPLDGHVITIEIEDSDFEEYKQIYIADVDNTSMSSEVKVSGYVVSHGEPVVVSHVENTNYGDTSLPTGHGSTWSRFVYSARMERPDYGYFGKLFAGLFVAVSIALISLLTQPTELDSRFGLAVGGMFAAVASEYVVTASLPDSNILTMADKLHILSFLVIFLTLGESTLSHKLTQLGHETAVWWMDRAAFVLFSTGFVFWIVAIAVWRV